MDLLPFRIPELTALTNGVAAHPAEVWLTL